MDDAKKLSKKQLEAKAQEMFDYHEDVDQFIVTEDGTFFTEDKKNFASIHGRETESKLHFFTRAGKEAEVADPEEIPSEKWKVDEIKQWLTDREIPFEGISKKADLLQLVDERAE